MRLVIIFGIFVSFVAYTTSTEYQWGQMNPDDDYLIADDKVSKLSWLFDTPTEKYVFKQKKDDRLTITGMNITDPKEKCRATVTLTKGGPGYNYANLQFVGKRGKSFKCRVKIWGVQ